MTRHVLVALWLGSATIAVVAQAPQKAPSGPIVDDKLKSTHTEVDANGTAVAVGGPYPEDAVGEGGGRRGRGGRRGQPPPQLKQQ